MSAAAPAANAAPAGADGAHRRSDVARRTGACRSEAGPGALPLLEARYHCWKKVNGLAVSTPLFGSSVPRFTGIVSFFLVF